MDVFAAVFIFFTIFVLFSLCGFCCKTRNEGAIYSTPVVITSQTHQPVGAPTAYPVHTGGVQTSYHHTVLVSPPPTMPMPYHGAAAPYPTGPAHPMPGAAPYTPAPYGQQATYPPTTSPYPTQSTPYPQQSAPYPSAQPDMNPPTYTDVVTNQSYQKQAPYNPNYSS